MYDNLPEPSETEKDMLDQAFGLTPTSRLGCQVLVTKELEGVTIKLPKAIKKIYVVSVYTHTCDYISVLNFSKVKNCIISLNYGKVCYFI